MQNTEPKAPNPMKSRRWFLLGGATVVAGSGLFGSRWFNIFANAALEGTLTVTDAHQLAQNGSLYLIDIRRPDEWARTGVAAPALPIDMRRDDFEILLRSVFETSGERPVALICARGVRSNRMNRRLNDAGFEQILDVPEGMLGSGAGPGYIATGLPLRPPTQAELDGQII